MKRASRGREIGGVGEKHKKREELVERWGEKRP